MAELGRLGLELAHRRLGASLVACDEDDPGAQPSKPEDGGLADA